MIVGKLRSARGADHAPTTNAVVNSCADYAKPPYRVSPPPVGSVEPFDGDPPGVDPPGVDVDPGNAVPPLVPMPDVPDEPVPFESPGVVAVVPGALTSFSPAPVPLVPVPIGVVSGVVSIGGNGLGMLVGDLPSAESSTLPGVVVGLGEVP